MNGLRENEDDGVKVWDETNQHAQCLPWEINRGKS
jgi:hypothetical protein